MKEFGLEQPGDRLVIYTRMYETRVWNIKHTIPEDHLLFFAMDEDFHTIIPSRVQKMGIGRMEVEFPVAVKGYGSVFRITPLLNAKSVSVSNKRSITIDHRYRSSDFLVQVWDTNGNLVVPRDIRKRKYNVTIDFASTPLTGPVELCRNAGAITKYVDESYWEDRYWVKEYLGNLFIQTNDSDGDVIIAGTEIRWDPIISSALDNKLKLYWNSHEIDGTLLPIIHGYRI